MAGNRKNRFPMEAAAVQGKCFSGVILLLAIFFAVFFFMTGETFAGTSAASQNKPVLRAMILDGGKGDQDLGADNDGAMLYDRLIHNELSGCHIAKENIHPFAYNNVSSPITREELNRQIMCSLGEAKDTDLSIFYYSGHSKWDGKSASEYGISLGGKDQYYQWKELTDFLASHVKGNVVIIMDACFSAYIQQNGVSSLRPEDQERFSVLTSCASDEFSSVRTAAWSVVHGKLNYGCFSFYLGKGLGFFDDRLYADANGDNKVTLKELYEYTKKQVDGDAARSSGMTVCAVSRHGNQVLFEYVPVLKISPRKLTLQEKKSAYLSVTKKSVGNKLKWKSGNKKVLKVSAKGKITGIKPGKSIVTVSANGKTASCTVTVLSKKSAAARAERRNVTKLAKRFTNTSGLEFLNRGKGKSRTLDFNRKSDRRRALKGICGEASSAYYDKNGKIEAAYVQNCSSRIFGKKTPGGSYTVGEWGASRPVLDSFQIKKRGGGYIVKARVYWKDDLGRKNSVGSMTLWTKKNKKAFYGFYASRLQLKWRADKEK